MAEEAKKAEVPKVTIDPKKATPEQIAEGLKLLEKKAEHKLKVQAGLVKSGVSYKDMTPEQKKAAQASARRRQARINIIMMKAKAAGLVVSEKEVDDYLKSVK